LVRKASNEQNKETDEMEKRIEKHLWLDQDDYEISTKVYYKKKSRRAAKKRRKNQKELRLNTIKLNTRSEGKNNNL
jgi:hypothetical protein